METNINPNVNAMINSFHIDLRKVQRIFADFSKNQPYDFIKTSWKKVNAKINHFYTFHDGILVDIESMLKLFRSTSDTVNNVGIVYNVEQIFFEEVEVPTLRDLQRTNKYMKTLCRHETRYINSFIETVKNKIIDLYRISREQVNVANYSIISSILSYMTK